MKAIREFFELLMWYQRLKHELKCDFETHKTSCMIRFYRMRKNGFPVKEPIAYDHKQTI